MPAGIQPNCSSLLPVVCFTWHSDWPWRHNSHSGRARNPTRSRTCLFASVRRQIDHLRNGLKMGACRSGALAARRRPAMCQGLLPVPESPPRRNRAKQTQPVEGLTLGAHPNGHPPESRPLVLNEDCPRVPLALQQLRGTEAGNPSIAGALAGSATWYGLSDHAGQG
jgi:hypothetical protein